MGSWKSWEEDYPSTILQSETQAELSVSGLNLRTHLSESKTDQEQALVARFQTNLILKENDTQNSEEKEKYGDTSDSGNGTKHQYALRPYAEDCPFFLKTGMCKFGSHCKFNHPARVGGVRMNEKGGVVEQNGQIECKFYLTQQGCKYGKACKFVHYKEKSDVGPLELNSFGLAMQLGVEEKERGTSGEEIGQIECKYYLTPGGCKYGEACKYNHSKEKSSTCIDKSEIPPPELNFLGLPIRVLEKECPFYMRTGSCAYGVDCRFHHPEPTADEGSNTFNSAPVGASMLGHCRGNQHGKLDSTGQTVESWSSGVRLDKTNSYFDNHLADLPEMLHSSQWRGYQDSIFAQERTRHFPPVPVIDNQGRTAAASRVHQQQTQEEFPERPGEPECAYYMKTGDCKYRSSCKFHHPKSHAPKSPLCVLSKTGLPLRPGRKICRHYEKHGICKFGQGCMFDHPEGHVSPAFPLVSVAEYPSETNPATFPVPEVAGCGNGSETPTQLSV